jgi:hypothetical protein
MRFLSFSGVAVLACSLFGGCNQADLPPLANASGVVNLDGKPLQDARVIFHPVDGGARMSYGTTDSSGTFKLSTFGMNDGGLIGRHRVAISKIDTPVDGPKIDVKKLQEGGYASGGFPGYESQMGIGGTAKGPKQEIPEKYSDKEKSQIEVEITAAGPNDFSFNLEKE